MTKAPRGRHVSAKTTAGKLCYCGRAFGHTGRHVNSPVKIDPGARLLDKARAEIDRHHAAIAKLKSEIRERQDALLTVESRLSPLVEFVSAWADVPALSAPRLMAAPPAPVVNRAPADVAPPGLHVQPVEESRSSPSSVPAVAAPALKCDGPDATPLTVTDPHVPTVSTRCSTCRRFRPGIEFIEGIGKCADCRAKAGKTAPGASAFRTVVPAAAEPADPVEAGFEAVAAWAAPRGISLLSWEDLPRVNRKREDLGLALFKRQMAKVRPGRLAAAMAL
jgi:hypothetical protein